jgi:diguanylate cyclase
LKIAHDRLEHLSRTDRLTELFNRGHWEECLEQEFKRCQRTLHPCSLVIFDIDHFKKVNDSYGHQAGDEVIRQVSNSLRKILRITDIAGRYGGEEFVALLIETDPNAALNFAERLREHIEQLVVKTDAHEICFTISLGISAWRPDFKNRQQWLESADKALYESKHAGRNRSTVGK